jgi:hypothetical protein
VPFSGPRRPPPSGPTAAPELIRFLAGGESCNRRNWFASLIRGFCLFRTIRGFHGARPADPLHAYTVLELITADTAVELRHWLSAGHRG